MNSKRLAKRLLDIGYRLDRDIFGWIVVSLRDGSDFRFSTLGGVNRFVVDNEAMVEWVRTNEILENRYPLSCRG